MLRSKLIFVSVLLLMVSKSYAFVDTINYSVSEGFTLAKLDQNILHDEQHTLYPFFESLKTTEHYRTIDPMSDSSLYTLSIVHIGDSHIQAGMGTAVTRKLFQQYFGAAGRGLVTPQRLSGSNEPRDYRFRSDNKWEATRLLKPTSPVGIGGVTLQLKADSASVYFETIDETFPGEWAFNEVITYYNSPSAIVNLSDSVTFVIQQDSLNIHSDRFCLDKLTSSFNFHISSPTDSSIVVYGFNLKNGRTGVFYHSIGINGARYANYAIAPLLSEQVGTLDASLIVVSLGTNEAYEKTVDEDKLYNNIHTTLELLRQSSPSAQFILTTPIESLRKVSRSKRVTNEKVVKVRNLIIDYAQKNKIAYWDLYSVAGGKGAALRWQKQGLMVRDGVHFSKAGYEYQGQLLFDAFMKTYNSYLKNTADDAGN